MIGELLGGYRLLSELGSGGMGTVYLARVEGERPRVKPGETVAVKVIHPHLLDRTDFVDRFQKEGKVGGRIRHRNVVQTIEVDAAEVGGKRVDYLVMEYVEGRTLRSLLDDLRAVPEALIREIAAQVASGLAAIHSTGIIHRDLKPENFLITDDDQVRIMDLGVARFIEESVRLTMDGHFAGSLYYAAPEQFRKSEVGPPADLYSLGVLLYELATGENPFKRDDAAGVLNAHLEFVPPRLADRQSEISPFLSEVVAALLEKKPADRFASASDLRHVLEEGEGSAWWGEREGELIRTTGHLPRIHVRRETNLYGRDTEIRSLEEYWAEARTGKGRTVLIEGEAGIGKTRLLDVFLRNRTGEDIHMLYGSYPPSGGIGGLSEAILSKFGAGGLDGAVEPYLTATPTLSPAFAAIVKHEAPPEDAEPVIGDALHAVLCHLLRGLAEEKPVLWIVDDLHFAKPDSRRLVLSMARTLEEHRVMLLCSTRPGLPEDELSHFSRLPSFARLELDRLSPREVIEVLQDAFRSEALAEKLGGKIAYKSDGVPFFVFEMVRGLKEGNFFSTLPDGTWVETRTVEEIQVPSAVRDLIEGRLCELTKGERALLDVGAVQGFRFDADLVSRVLDRKRVAVLQDLAEVERRSGVVRSVGAGYRFDHHQIQEVIYADLPEGLRREYHSLLAEALADRSGLASLDPADAPGEASVLFVLHHLRGSRPEAAVPLLPRALDHLDDAYRNQAALEIVDLALGTEGLLEGDERADVLLTKVVKLELLGRRDEEREILDEVFLLADASVDLSRRAKYRRLLGWHLARASQMEEAEERLKEAVVMAGLASEPEEEVSARSVLGNLYRNLGRYDESTECHQLALEQSRSIGSRRGELVARVGLGSVAWSLGRYEEAQRQYHDALDIAREIGERRDEAIAKGNLGLVHAELGRNEDAVQCNEQALEILREIGDRRNEGNFTGNLGLALAQLGRYEEALELHERSRRISREIGDLRGQGISLVNLGPLYAHLGDITTARELLAGVRESLTGIGARQALGYAIQAEGELAALEGDRERGIELFRESAEVLREVKDEVGRAGSMAAFGVLLLEDDRVEEATESLCEALDLAREYEVHDTIVLCAVTLALAGGMKPEDAIEEYLRHETRLRHSSRMEVQFLLYRLTGESERLETAHRLLLDLRDRAPTRYRTTILTDVPLHTEILAAVEAAEA